MARGDHKDVLGREGEGAGGGDLDGGELGEEVLCEDGETEPASAAESGDDAPTAAEDDVRYISELFYVSLTSHPPRVSLRSHLLRCPM